jgi:4'-phosphopantetheinyl transferase EntD
VASSDELDALGIDVEVAQRLEAGILDQVMQATDRLEAGEATPVVIFSAKESVFKALFPESGVWMAFDAVSLRHGSDAGSLRVAPTGLSPAAPGVEDLRGGYRVSAEWVATGFWRHSADAISRRPTKR